MIKKVEKLNWTTKFQSDFTKEFDFLEKILNSYGITDIHTFLNPKKSDIYDPFLMKNMEDGVKLFDKYIRKDTCKILIRIDCDVDGNTSAALIAQFIKALNPAVEIIFVYNYDKEHGLTFKDMKNFTRDEIDLIIVPDASIVMEDMINIKKNFSADILVLDHHIIETEYLNSKTHKWESQKGIDTEKEDCYTNYCTAINDTDGEYPNPDLSGVGVVMKFCEAYCKYYDMDSDFLDQWLDLVSLGISSDNMSLKNKETRYYVIEGLQPENLCNSFLNELQARNEDEFKFGRTILNQTWTIAPRINGCIRYGKPVEQQEMFRALIGEKEDVKYQPRRKKASDPKPPVEMHTLQWDAARIANNVKSRQDTEVRKFMGKIEEKIEEQDLNKNSVLFVDSSDIVDKKTVTGLVANKLATKYMKPVVLLRSKDAHEFGGSCRNYSKGNIPNLMEFLNKAGVIVKGHENAGGVFINKDNVKAAIAKCNEMMPVNKLCTIHQCDWEIPADKLKNEYVKEVANNYKIWGNDIPEPIFAITDLRINASQIIGYGENKGFIRFVHNGITYIKKYCPIGDYEAMTLRDKHVFGVNKKNLKLNIIAQFMLNAWEDKVSPEVKILYYDVVEDLDAKPLNNSKIISIERNNTIPVQEKEKSTAKKTKIDLDDDDFVF